MRGHQSRCHCERMSKSVGAREGVSACKNGVFVGASDSIVSARVGTCTLMRESACRQAHRFGYFLAV